MKQWPYKWRSSEGWRTMPKGGCSKTPQQEEFSLSNDMVEKQTGKKVTLGLALLFSSSLPPVLPPGLSLTLTFLSSLPSSPFLILTPSNPCPHTHLSSAHSPCLNRDKGWECHLACSGCLSLCHVFSLLGLLGSQQWRRYCWVGGWVWRALILPKRSCFLFRMFIVWGPK